MSRGSSFRFSLRPTHGWTLPFPLPLLDLEFPLCAMDHLAPAARADVRLLSLRDAVRTALTMCSYPVQRHRLPLMASRISVSLGLAFRASRSCEHMIIPGVQKPHCRPCSSPSPSWISCSLSPAASPSMVVSFFPSACRARTVQDFTACPSISTVQAPQREVSQPT